MLPCSPDLAVRNNVIGYHHHRTPNVNSIYCATPKKDNLQIGYGVNTRYMEWICLLVSVCLYLHLL